MKIRFKVPSVYSPLLAGALLCSAGLTVQASSTIVKFSVDMSTNVANGNFTPGTDAIEAHGTFNGWGAYTLVQDSSQLPEYVYTNSFNDTSDANGGQMQYKFVINGNNWESLAGYNGSLNRYALLPATSGASLALPVAFFGDAGAAATNEVTFQVDVSQQIALGNFVPGTSTVEVRGNNLPNTWSGGNTLTLNPAIIETNQYGLKTTNVYTGTYPVSGSPGGLQEYKFVINGPSGAVWDSPNGIDSDGDGNRYFQNAAQTLPLANFSDQTYAPLVNVRFSVDMSAIAISDTSFQPSTVTLNGDFNGWSAGLACTNNPSAANTNIYYSPYLVAGVGSTVNYQFRYDDSGTGATNYDSAPGGGNRQLVVPNVNPTNVPPVWFNNIYLTDLLNQDTTVTFSINMTNAVGPGNPGVAFDPGNDGVFVNGDFTGWQSWNPIALASYQGQVAAGSSEAYTYQQVIPAGHSRIINYLWVFNDADSGTGIVFAPGNNNIVRYIRSTNGVDVLPMDKFGATLPNGNRYSESKVGNVSIGAPSGGNVPISWLGYPGMTLQTTTSLGGPWQGVPNTDTQNSTSVPSTSQQFFRLQLIEPTP